MIDDYIETYTGVKVSITDPRPEQINIVDIAHSLSMLCRFNGHSDKFYSVAEHSVYVSRLVRSDLSMHGLLHDASEAYLSDIASPVKPHLTNYKIMEDMITKIIFEKFDIEYNKNHHDEIKVADVSMLRLEAYTLMASQGTDWSINDGVIDISELNALIDIKALSPSEAKLLFLEEFNLLKGN